MRNGFKFMGMAALAALSLTALAIQEGVILKRTAKTGDVAKFRMKADMDTPQGAVTFSALFSEKVIKASETGDYTVEETQTDGKAVVAGAEYPAPDTPVVTTTYKSTGEVVAVDSSAADPNMYRMANLQSMRFSSKPVKVGDTWNVEIKKDSKGSVDAKGEYKIEAREKIGNYDTFRIHATFKETSGEAPASIDGTYWVNVADGALIKLQGTWTNFPIPQMGPLTMKVTMTREG
jgi:hypothetical protein